MGNFNLAVKAAMMPNILSHLVRLIFIALSILIQKMIKTKFDEVTITALILAVVLSNVAPIYYWVPVFAICIALIA